MEECVLIFKSENEKEAFEEYVICQWGEREKYEQGIHLPYFPEIEGYVMEEFRKEYKSVMILQKMLYQYRRLE